MVEDFVLVQEQLRIEFGLAGGPEALPSKTSRIIGIVVSEEHVLAEEIMEVDRNAMNDIEKKILHDANDFFFI